jgi:hypothetical protein
VYLDGIEVAGHHVLAAVGLDESCHCRSNTPQNGRLNFPQFLALGRWLEMP